MNTTGTEVELARVVREHTGRLATSLVSLIGDFSAAEDLRQNAAEAALQHWPHEGIPANPDGGRSRIPGTFAAGALRSVDRAAYP